MVDTKKTQGGDMAAVLVPEMALNRTPSHAEDQTLPLKKEQTSLMREEQTPPSAEEAVTKDPFLEDLKRVGNTLPDHVGVFHVRTANQVISEAQACPDPNPLYDKLWNEGELCCLFSDSNLGKSIYAVQMGAHIARNGHRVLYFDFELSKKQFQMRYTTPEGQSYMFPDTFLRAEIASELLGEKYDERLLKDIETAALTANADVVIIDNLTWVCAESEKGGDAAKMMMELMNMKKKYNFSMLIIAHTPKRDASRPLTANDLAGSKKIFNFFDSVFALGRSAQDENLRYVKQLKCRYGEIAYGSQNVRLCSIEQSRHGLLRMTFQGFSTEREHLKEPSDKAKDELVEKVRELSKEGKSCRMIAEMLHVSKSKVNRLLCV